MVFRSGTTLLIINQNPFNLFLVSELEMENAFKFLKQPENIQGVVVEEFTAVSVLFCSAR